MKAANPEEANGSQEGHRQVGSRITRDTGHRQAFAVARNHLIDESAKAASLPRAATGQAEAQNADGYTHCGYDIHRMPCCSSFRTSRGPGRYSGTLAKSTSIPC